MKFDQTAIQQGVELGNVLIFEEIDSTNAYLLAHCQALPTGSICLAEMQTAGRGRRGRQWYSPLRNNLYCSLLWRYEAHQTAELASLSLVVAVVIAETLHQLGVPDIQIKWPNDIYFQGKKMGGILIENRIVQQQHHLVIGVGLNLAMGQVEPDVITQQWADLAKFELDRDQLTIELVNRLQQALQHFPTQRFSAYRHRWQAFDGFYQQPVQLLTETRTIYGIAQGVNEQGELLLQQGEQITAFSIGEISLRADEQAVR